jgi:hypothetical protein
MKAKRMKQYVGGFKTPSGSNRNYLYTILEGKHKGLQFYREIVTPRFSEDEWGEGFSQYYIDMQSPMFDTVEQMIESLKKKK